MTILILLNDTKPTYYAVQRGIMHHASWGVSWENCVHEISYLMSIFINTNIHLHYERSVLLVEKFTTQDINLVLWNTTETPFWAITLLYSLGGK